MSASWETMAWWTGVPSVRTTVVCGDDLHHLIWEDGVLSAPDHADAEGERALAALGGEPLACITMLDAWRRYAEDPEVLLLGSRGPNDRIAATKEFPGQQRRMGMPMPGGPPVPGARMAVGMARAAWFSGTGASGGLALRPGASDAESLAELLSLGGGLDRRLQSTVAAHWRARLATAGTGYERMRTPLHAALYGRVLAALVSWLGREDLAFELTLAPEGAEPSISFGAHGQVVARLSFGWLVEVWARGLEIVWGRFCLSASTSDGRNWELYTIDPDLKRPAPIKVTLPA